MSLLRSTFSWFRVFTSSGKKPAPRSLEYRATLRQAEARGDTAFLDAEIAKYQPTEADLRRFREQKTPIDTWPEADPDLFLPEDLPAGKPNDSPTDAS